MRSLIGSALKKSCFQCVGNAFGVQIKRLLSAGYSLDFIVSSARRLLVRASVTAERVQGGTFAVVPYFHGFSHSLKALGAKFNVNVVFKTDFRLDRLTPFTFRREGCCGKKHRDPSVSCVAEVVYKIPFDCGLCYVGQTGRCLNDRLAEHKRNVRNRAQSSELANHVGSCNNCSPL